MLKNIHINYPVYASDYLDLSGYGGHGSVAGIVDNQQRIIIGYKKGLTYAKAVKLAKAMNQREDNGQ